MVGKTIAILLDGLDYAYIRENQEQLPFFKALYEGGRLGPLASVVPADSIPSWTTIYTGLNPAEHGILESIDYLDFKNKVKGDYSVICGNTFWDVLGEQGKRVFIFNPFMAYPAWDVNGLMICGPVFEGGEVSANRPELVDFSALPPIGGMVDHPADREMEAFFRRTMELSQRQFDVFCQYFERDSYDFAFLGITTPDRMQHFLWRYTDPGDRTHPKGGRLADSIREMYQLMEKNVKRIMDRYGDAYQVVVFSDHGHGRRCEKVFYINEWLIRQGFIPDRGFKKRAVEYGKNSMFRILDALHIVEPGTKFFKQFAFVHKVKNAEYVFSGRREAVYAPKFDGTNPYGGILLDRSLLPEDASYETLRGEIIRRLLKVEDQGSPVMLWVKKREEIYAGEHVENYPDIVYRMQPEYGVDRGLFGRRLFGINAMHWIISGGHKPEGVIMGSRPDACEVGSVLNLHDYLIRISGGENR